MQPITLAIWTGFRTGELCPLACEGIDLDKREVTVHHNITILRQFKMLKTGQERSVVLLPPALKALDVLYKITRHKPAHQVTKHLRDRRKILEACTFVFVPTIKNRNPIQTGCFAVDSLGGKWGRLVKRAGIRHQTQYHTRHIFASRMLSAGAIRSG
ncbi:tyrosine-type recombinase/integrase [Aeromonas hydrophila]